MDESSAGLFFLWNQKFHDFAMPMLGISSPSTLNTVSSSDVCLIFTWLLIPIIGGA
jgi:hypothetical protein